MYFLNKSLPRLPLALALISPFAHEDKLVLFPMIKINSVASSDYFFIFVIHPLLYFC